MYGLTVAEGPRKYWICRRTMCLDNPYPDIQYSSTDAWERDILIWERRLDLNVCMLLLVVEKRWMLGICPRRLSWSYSLVTVLRASCRSVRGKQGNMRLLLGQFRFTQHPKGSIIRLTNPCRNVTDYWQVACVRTNSLPPSYWTRQSPALLSQSGDA